VSVVLLHLVLVVLLLRHLVLVGLPYRRVEVRRREAGTVPTIADGSTMCVRCVL
jgi:hypothetical protein